MLHRILLASVGAMALTGVTLAADLPTNSPPPIYLPPHRSSPGPASISAASSATNGAATAPTSMSSSLARLSLVLLPSPPSPTSCRSIPIRTGRSAVPHIGYNWQIAQWVLGVEADVDATNYHGHAFGLNNDPASFSGTAVRDKIRSSIEGSFRGRIGWAWNRFLLYGTGGIAFADVTNDYGESFASGEGAPALISTAARAPSSAGRPAAASNMPSPPIDCSGWNTATPISAVSRIPASSGSTTPAACSAANSTRIII